MDNVTTCYELNYHDQSLSAELLGYAAAYKQIFLNVDAITIHDNYFIGYKITVASDSPEGMEYFLKAINAFQSGKKTYETPQ